MTDPAVKAREIEHEREMERRYAEELQTGSTLLVHRPRGRGGRWTGRGIPPRRALPLAQLVGRVALVETDTNLGGISDFYIGHAYANIDGMDVYNWRNPFCQAFFYGTRLTRTGNNAAAVRTFDHQNGMIVGFVDDAGSGESGAQPFSQRSNLDHVRQQQPTSSPSSGPVEMTRRAKEGDNIGETIPTPSPALHAPSEHHEADPPKVRAEPLLVASLSAPRPRKLESALSTLQSDQYELITAPATDSMVVEGGPGTGKSIVATHRAAYFINPDDVTEDSFSGDVVVVGPTSRYVAYVSDVIDELTGGSPRVQVLALSQLSNQGAEPSGGVGDHPRRVGAGGRKVSLQLVHTAVARILADGRNNATETDVYECLRKHGTVQPLANLSGWRSYLRSLPPHAEAVAQGTHWLFRESIGRHLAAPTGQPQLLRHIIVDEAQDVTTDQWSLLRELNATAGWTILGDFYQRRDERGLRSWAAVLDAAALPSTTPVRQLRRGYRSTAPILEFASRLLYPGAPRPIALQSRGCAPRLVRTSPVYRTVTTVQEVHRLTARYPSGTVAVISSTPWEVTSRLQSTPDLGGVSVLLPSECRGLEFDAVVVVDPAEFPCEKGRYGPLYTALTRANRELVIVHTKSLPAAR